eukprot:9706385-Alexandrium_andersonii.AAC.1
MVDQAQGVPGLQRSNRATVGHLELPLKAVPLEAARSQQYQAQGRGQCDNGSRKGCGKGMNKCAKARPTSEYRSPNTERNTSQAHSSET